MHRKGAQDKKRAKMYTKLTREISVAAKFGIDPDANPRLRSAIKAARDANVPKERIQNALNSHNNKDAADLQEIRYEGYGPGGVALMVEAMTDNRNRTASEVRSAFSKYHGQLGETGSVSFLFNRIGLIVYELAVSDTEQMFAAAIENGANDYYAIEEEHHIITEPESLNIVREKLEELFSTPLSAKITWVAINEVPVTSDAQEQLEKLLDALEDCDDVQDIIGNFTL